MTNKLDKSKRPAGVPAELAPKRRRSQAGAGVGAAAPTASMRRSAKATAAQPAAAPELQNLVQAVPWEPWSSSKAEAASSKPATACGAEAQPAASRSRAASRLPKLGPRFLLPSEYEYHCPAAPLPCCQGASPKIPWKAAPRPALAAPKMSPPSGAPPLWARPAGTRRAAETPEDVAAAEEFRMSSRLAAASRCLLQCCIDGGNAVGAAEKAQMFARYDAIMEESQKSHAAYVALRAGFAAEAEAANEVVAAADETAPVPAAAEPAAPAV